jgi:hypothetical protein
MHRSAKHSLPFWIRNLRSKLWLGDGTLEFLFWPIWFNPSHVTKINSHVHFYQLKFQISLYFLLLISAQYSKTTLAIYSHWQNTLYVRRLVLMTEYARNDIKEVPQVHNILYITWNEPTFPTILQTQRTSASRIISILPI